LEKLLGRIHSFESFGTVDGPGIRYVIFMQGCPLRCKYCHNRDTWDAKKGEEYDVETIYNKIIRCKTYIDSSNGGVTVSGGEPLLQAKFLIELFKKLKENGFHTAIDTSGNVPLSDDIKELLKYTSLVILDIKHIDSKKCEFLTGLPNENELSFAKYLSENNIPMWIRQVLVPGITDNKEDLIKTRKFIDSLSTVEKVEVLPYHDLGKYKWNELGEKYPLEDTPLPSDESIKMAKEILKDNNKKGD